MPKGQKKLISEETLTVFIICKPMKGMLLPFSHWGPFNDRGGDTLFKLGRAALFE